ncbi:hypothetical protein SERLA73DRAFT_145023 [Serpula lacrymans var. lacrymans S7.3]|uniref:Uncharacterized protein n=2 Tax=Serpula lacrymans var. lacrymans TaxID=341189 RepID=F8QCV0_SERL3|nr:uncharacterized protein SERLADRAFT_402800 [Serpula lacrymans var. lacrymans S7.9]EGN93965.1 hypothetical protein SERLA73DRAFT_145023 [Serpula lacrymans var. lacrymans S7.3]EGO19331.1 hypothetical protein SERLADRAFT_402800 [Serpula lacrymans var. lacrymans S7.9]
MAEITRAQRLPHRHQAVFLDTKVHAQVASCTETPRTKRMFSSRRGVKTEEVVYLPRRKGRRHQDDDMP